jgi:hypothetical protein
VIAVLFAHLLQDGFEVKTALEVEEGPAGADAGVFWMQQCHLVLCPPHFHVQLILPLAC